MAIQDRRLEAGSILTGSYRKERYECRIEDEEGKLILVLGDAVALRARPLRRAP